ncbi:MAG: hypothetical protein HY644_13625 [Acidobacteria bacterium]|nr:hypothetical protein [Acidobacteriota bacterium]
MTKHGITPIFLVLVVFSGFASAARINFPQVADGGGFSTTFTFINTGNSAISGILALLNQDGTPRTLRLNGVANSLFSVTVPGNGGTVRLTSANEGAAQAGWAYFESPSINVQGVATFDLRAANGALITSASVLAVGGIPKGGIPVNVTSPSINTGAAIAALGQAVVVRLHLINETGVEVASVVDPRLNPLGPNRQVSAFANEYFPSVSGINNFRGSLVVEVVGAGQVAVTGLLLKEGLLSALPVVEFSAVTSARLKADYQFQNVLSSSVAGAPDLSNLGNNTFGNVTVDGNPRTVLRFAANDGLALAPTTGVISPDTYTIVVLFSFTDISGYRKILDFNNGTADRGLFIRDGELVLYPVGSGTGAPVAAGTFVQVVLTRGSDKRVVGYVNGVKQFTASDAEEDARISDQVTLIFFRNKPDSSGASAGSVARIRLYDGPISEEEVARLDRAP